MLGGHRDHTVCWDDQESLERAHLRQGIVRSVKLVHNIEIRLITKTFDIILLIPSEQ